MSCRNEAKLMTCYSMYKSEDTEQDSLIDFNPEGLQPYNLEPVVREAVESANYDKLNGMRGNMERDNVDKIHNSNW